MVGGFGGFGSGRRSVPCLIRDLRSPRINGVAGVGFFRNLNVLVIDKICDAG